MLGVLVEVVKRLLMITQKLMKMAEGLLTAHDGEGSLLSVKINFDNVNYIE